jgi:hypothetical protein
VPLVPTSNRLITPELLSAQSFPHNKSAFLMGRKKSEKRIMVLWAGKILIFILSLFFEIIKMKAQQGSKTSLEGGGV